MNKITKIIGLLIAIAFLVGLATTLTRSMMIGFLDVMPVYILMGIAIFMMIYEAFFDKKKLILIKKNNSFSFFLLFIQPIFMTSNIAIARGALDNIPPIALASSRWFLVFLVFLPFVYSTLIKKKKIY